MGREPTLGIRFPGNQFNRSPPLPNLPPGVSHKLSANYYYTRDGRREIDPDETVAVNSSSAPTRLLSSGESDTAVAVATKKYKTPGGHYGFGSGMQ